MVRVHARQINVDDYAYASLARNILHSGSPISTFLHSGTSSLLVPALAAPGAELGGVYGAMSVELPFLLVLVTGFLPSGQAVDITAGGDGGCSRRFPQRERLELRCP